MVNGGPANPTGDKTTNPVDIVMSFLDEAEDIGFMYKTAIERDPKKRRIKPVETQSSLLDFDLGESSDDSDFRIEDHAEESGDDSIDSNGEGGSGDSSDDDSEDEEDDSDELESEVKIAQNGVSVAELLNQAKSHQSDKLQLISKDVKVLICCGCLGDRSDDINEIVECDGCGVTVHEACYGVSDSASVVSSESDCPTEPWFCDACKAGVTNPVCELCPNLGGIFKETDVGKWVHLVCALYVPGVAFGEVDRLSSVTLFELQYSKWGAKSCSLCPDERFSRTGICIGCDAGMCRTYFHVTCAQREGFLSEAHSEEVDQADPFYAHCKLHSDKTQVRRRKKNWLALQLRTHNRRLEYEQVGHSDTPEQLRIQRKLKKHRVKYINNKSLKSPPWVPTQKMPRLLTTSASACKKLLRKANLMGIDTLALEVQEAQMAALVDIRKKWHISPAFSVEFIAYYLDRNDRLKSMKKGLEELISQNGKLLEEHETLRIKYDKIIKENADESRVNINLRQSVHKYHSAILSSCPTKNLPNLDDLGKPAMVRTPAPTLSVPTAAALKMGVGFPLNNIPSGRHDHNRVLSSQGKQDQLLLNECGICRQKRDQHLLAKCDTCHLYYHLNCLNPPLSRLPKKSKLYGWQCSECDKSSDSEVDVHVKLPRRSRSKYSKENGEEMFVGPKVKIKPVCPDPAGIKGDVYDFDGAHLEGAVAAAAPSALASSTQLVCSTTITNNHVDGQVYGEGGAVAMGPDALVKSSKSGKKRRREKHRSHHSNSDDPPTKEHKRKRKKKILELMEDPISHPRIKIKIKPIPLPAGEVASTSNPQCFYVPQDSNDAPPSLPMTVGLSLTPPHGASPKRRQRTSSTCKKVEVMTHCDVCQGEGSSTNLVRCDECQKCYHFTCLEPPVKKSPKRRGYSWHCADCDPTEPEDNK